MVRVVAAESRDRRGRYQRFAQNPAIGGAKNKPDSRSLPGLIFAEPSCHSALYGGGFVDSQRG